MTPTQMAVLHSACFTAPRPWTAAEFETVLGMSHVFTLTQEGGFLIGRCVAGEAELLTLAVPPTARRAGTGTLLVENFLHHAALLGGQDAFLEVGTENAGAIALYRKLDFEIAATRKAYMVSATGAASDAYVMRREIVHDAP